MFTRLSIKDWRQFSNIDIVFHEHLTVLTGANGAGKTTVLNLLSKSTGWNPQFVSSYEKDEKGVSKYFNSLKSLGQKLFIKLTSKSLFFLSSSRYSSIPSTRSQVSTPPASLAFPWI